MREAANCSQIGRNWAGSEIIKVPQIHWDLCRRNVLVQERIHGIPIDNIEKLKEFGVNFERLAKNGVRIFFTQVFHHNLFHADMHPGNVFVDVTDPNNPKYAAVDFGIVGSLDEKDREYLAKSFNAFFEKDYGQIANNFISAGWVPEETKANEFESAIRTVCDPIADKPLEDISFGQLLFRLFETARDFNMVNQPQLIQLEKTLHFIGWQYLIMDNGYVLIEFLNYSIETSVPAFVGCLIVLYVFLLKAFMKRLKNPIYLQ